MPSRVNAENKLGKLHQNEIQILRTNFAVFLLKLSLYRS